MVRNTGTVETASGPESRRTTRPRAIGSAYPEALRPETHFTFAGRHSAALIIRWEQFHMKLSRCAPSTGPALGTESDIDQIKALDERSVVGFLHPGIDRGFVPIKSFDEFGRPFYVWESI